jgi:PTS system nitrogen regulatory IIA component
MLGGHIHRGGLRMKSIGQLLSPADILLDVDVSTKTAVFEEAGRLFEQRHGLLQAQVVERLSAREELGSTGLGLGIALPHARVPNLPQPAAAFMRLKRPIPFDSPDGKPVSHVVIFLVPEDTTEEHLDMLAEITQMFGDRAFRERMRSCENPDAVSRLFSGWPHSY